jgi:uncharacterized repeat protein (TIGR02543 family)
MLMKRFVGIIIFVTAVLLGCDLEVDTSLQKKITITHIPSAYNGRYGTSAFGHEYNGNILAQSNTVIINNGFLTLKMYDYNAYPYSKEFTENGTYQIHFQIDDNISSDIYWYGFIERMYITDEKAEISFNDFTVVSNEFALFSISFNSNGGNEISPISDVRYGQKIEKPVDPIKEGCFFKGWYKEEQLINSWDFSSDRVTANLTLYAKWRLIEDISPTEVSNITQQFDYSHNIVLSWSEPEEEDFSYVKIYEDGNYITDIMKGNNSYILSSFDVSSIEIQTADDLDNISNGITYQVKANKEAGVVRIIIKDINNIPLYGANILGFASNKTTKLGSSNAKGAVFLDYSENQEITFLIAHPSFEGLICTANTSQNYSYSFTNDNKGSILAPRGTCYIPGLTGRLNPIKDTLNRLYLYADNIAINAGLQQPVYFDLVNPLSLEDANGNRKNVWIPFIDGDTSLINYSPK